MSMNNSTVPHESRIVVSVVTVVFNGVGVIEETIRSVFEQEYKNIDYVIIDGGSDDGTLEIINRYKSRLSKIVSEKDNGIYDAMNKGIEFASGDYVCFLNAGDKFCNSRTLKNLFEGITENSLPDVLYGNSIVLTDDEKNLGELKSLDFTCENLISRGTRTLCHQAIFVKMSRVPLYDTQYKLKGELNWYFEILSSKESLVIKKRNLPVVYYKLGGVGDTNFYKNLFERVLVVKNRFGYVRTILNTHNYLISILFRYRTKLKSLLK